MEDISIITKISFIGIVLCAYLWYRTSPESRYETLEMETVSTKQMFLVLAFVCFGFFLASLFLWK